MTSLSACELLQATFADPGGRLIEDENEGFLLCDPLTPECMNKALADVLFALPTGRGMSYLPNPSQRFCLDLRDGTDAKDGAACGGHINWFRSRKMRRHLSDFRVVVKTKDFRPELEHCKEYHLARAGGTWLTNALMDMICAAADAAGAGAGGVQHYCFSLHDRATGTLLACTFGFASGRVFEDYTMCTLHRDSRSVGAVLSKLVGFLLQASRFDLWYWGYKVAYMEDYRSHYGATELDRKSFYEIWEKGRSHGPRQLVCLGEAAGRLPRDVDPALLVVGVA